ncbi:hypothetical protein Pyn_32089 [Prunus yedoensis var. nudiflora]|uniref:PB1 domain-containing protein n=1 Tax=Prunus yedoensis var. nudiflora TaxID=2094558 RepID=A0A314UX58_PRUYE|nr:hypothetical protein Pyn_32089 [Prunus yedoensis var. nudiflora]
MDQHKTDDNLRYVGGLTRVLAADASISFAELMVKLAEFCGYSVDLRCQLPDEGFQNADAGGDCEKNEDEDDFSFTLHQSRRIANFHRRYIPKWLDPSNVPDFQPGSPIRRCRLRRYFQSQRCCRFVFLSTVAIEEALF